MSRSEIRRTTRIFRRTYLAAVGTGVLTSLAGCSGDIDSDEPGSPRENGGGEGTNDAWSQQTKLTPNDESVTNFGASVALAGDAALVSAQLAKDNEKWAGSAYVFERTDGTWSQLAELTHEDSDRDDNFGWGEGRAAALAGDTALVGAERDDDPNGPEAGSAYVFERTDGSWSSGPKLIPDDGDRKDFFGKSVALTGDGTTALIGAPRNEDSNGESAGSAYVFDRTDGAWGQQVNLTPENGDFFGWSVALAGDTAIIGAPGDDVPNGENAGSAYVFQRNGSTWGQQAKLASDDGDMADFFGGSVAIEGDTSIIGAPHDEDPNGEDAGSAYVFERTDGAWSQQAKLVPDNGDSGDVFGAAVALTGDGTTALVGARVDEDPNGEDAGSAFVFERTDGAWSQQSKLTPEDGEGGDVFGRSVALAGETALIGSVRGKAHVFSGAEV